MSYKGNRKFLVSSFMAFIMIIVLCSPGLIFAASTNSLPFTATFENGQDIPTWQDTQESNSNVTGYIPGINPECSLRSNEILTGNDTAIMYSGYANGGAQTYIYFKVFSVNLKITKDTVLSYWIMPQQDNGRYVGVDFHFTDGTCLRNLGALDQNGYNVHPGYGHGGNIPLDSWSEIRSKIGQWADGRTVDKIWIAYDRAGSTGQFRGYIDDISISDDKILSTSFESNQVQPTAKDTLEWVTNVSGYLQGINPECSIRAEGVAKSGTTALMYSGYANGGNPTNMGFIVFNEKIAVTSDMVLDYYIYPQNVNGRYVSVDFHCTDGSNLHDTGAVDQNGYSVHPGQGHGGNIPLNAWSEIRCNVGQWLSGKTIDKIWVDFDHTGSTGQIRGYIDDLKIYNNNSTGVSIAPGCPNIKYSGRWDNSSPDTYKSYYGGSYFKVKFTGTTVQLKLAGPVSIFAKIDNGSDVAYNGVSGIVNLTPTPLANGEHTLRVTARSQFDVIKFQGLILDNGATTKITPLGSKIIEFIGDSITEGYTNPNEAISDYAWKTGEQLGCEHTQIAYAGICLKDGVNYYLTHPIGMSVAYFKMQPTEDYPYTPDWDSSRYTPNIIVINLGTNDAFGGVSEADFQSAYTSFLAGIRTKFPNAEIIVLRTFGALPDVPGGFMTTPTQNAVNARINAGDTKVHYVNTNGWVTLTGDFTDGVHPSESGHDKITQQLVTILQPYLN